MGDGWLEVGMIASAVWTLAILIAGSLITMWIEPRAVRVFGGKHGQTVAAETHHSVIPGSPDTWLYYAAPFVALLAVAWGVLVIPFSNLLIGNDVNIGLFFFLVVIDFLVLGIAVGGWGANTPNAVEACYRVVGQLVAYVIPLGLAVIGPIMMARSLSILNIANAQADAGLWYIIAQPLGFVLYIVTAWMQTYRAPFAEPFSDLIQRGVLNVYGGWAAAAWRVALAGVLFVAAAMGAALFLGGFHGPFLPGPIWMLVKTIVVLLVILWAGSKVRLRSTAEMLAFSWKVLIPVGLLNVLVVGGLILLGVGQSAFR